MTRREFLSQLREALEGNISSQAVQENVNYYDQYISDEIKNGKTEEEVLQMLGDPWVLSRTIIAANQGNASQRGTKRTETKDSENRTGFHLDNWWQWVLLILLIIVGVMLVFTIMTGLIRFLAPVLIPVVIILALIRIFRNRRG